jgi:hypothetical protein
MDAFRQLPLFAPPRNAWLVRWLSAPTCQPPCWEQITPGVTTLDEALDLLAGLPDVRDVSLERDYGAQWELRDHDFASVRVDEGVVQFLRIRINTREQLRLAEVIDIFGYRRRFPSKAVRTDTVPST